MPFFVKMYFLLLKQIDIRRFHIYNIIYIGFCIFMGAEKYAIYYNNYEELDTKISELDIYEDRTIDRMSQDEVRNKISELTDEDTKFRLNAWLEHDPAEIFSNIGVPSLQEYIVFLYPGFGLAVFESFVPGNAYYAFRYTEFEKLLNQVSSLTKTQMLMNSAFLNRGYHLQDNVKTKEKINLLFVQK